MTRCSNARCLALALLCSAAPAAPCRAQPVERPLTGVLTGYGSVSYQASTGDDFDNDFTTHLSPVVLYGIGSDILLEAEVELELEEAATSVHLEHAQIHYLGWDRVQVTAGRFHLPFGAWMHPDWVNRMPTPPLLYADTHGTPAHDALMPIPFDVGIKASATVPLVPGWRTSATLWVSQGPASGIAPHVHEGEEEEEPESAAPPLAYGANYEDNNSDKMVGMRLQAVSASGLTVQVAGFRAAYDDAGDLGVRGANLSVMWAPGGGAQPLFDLRGEGILLGQEFLDGAEVRTVDYGGHYVQVSRRMGSWQPVARWSYLPETIAGEGPVVEGRRQIALGMNYWLTSSVPFKAAYQFELDGDDGFFLQWVVGF